MLSRIGLSAAVLTVSMFSAGSLAIAGPAPVHDCDHLAASPDDADHPEGVAGVAYADLMSSDEAVLACEQAIEAYPNERRFRTNLGRLYVKREAYREAMKVYLTADAMGSAVAAHNLGSLYSDGLGVPENQREATRYYRKAAHRGLPYSMFMIGDRMRQGVGTTKNAGLAMYWYEKAAKLDDAHALNGLGILYHTGEGVRADSEKAAELFERSAESAPSNPSPIYHLAKLYEEGIGDAEPDLTKALSLYITAFILGDTDVAQKVGGFYEEGKGTDPDPETAVDWYLMGSEAGSVEATAALAASYETGNGVEADIDAARQYYLQALAMNPDGQLREYLQKRLNSLGRHRQTN